MQVIGFEFAGYEAGTGSINLSGQFALGKRCNDNNPRRRLGHQPQLLRSFSPTADNDDGLCFKVQKHRIIAHDQVTPTRSLKRSTGMTYRTVR